jgi:hypothetical protein
MAQRGTKKKPASLTAINGGKMHVRVGAQMPESPPQWLLDDMDASGSPMLPAAIRFWQEYAPKLNARGITDDLHLPKFAMLCMAWAGWLADPTDYKIINPARGLAAEFAMDPASSAKLGMTDDGKSPLAKMLEAQGL